MVYCWYQPWCDRTWAWQAWEDGRHLGPDSVPGLESWWTARLIQSWVILRKYIAGSCKTSLMCIFFFEKEKEIILVRRSMDINWTLSGLSRKHCTHHIYIYTLQNNVFVLIQNMTSQIYQYFLVPSQHSFYFISWYTSYVSFVLTGSLFKNNL